MPAKKRRTRHTGFGSIKLPSGRFQARYKGANEKNYTAPTTFATKGEAEGFLSEISRAIELNIWLPPEVIEARRVRDATTVSAHPPHFAKYQFRKKLEFLLVPPPLSSESRCNA